MAEIKLYGQQYVEIRACLDLIKKFSTESNILSYRGDMREIFRYADMAERYLKLAESTAKEKETWV